MRYGDIGLKPSDVEIENAKIVEVIKYPLRLSSDSALRGREPTVISCALAFTSFAEVAAMKQLALLNVEEHLYVDETATDSHYYKRVIVALGKEKRLRGGVGWSATATFTALDPLLYDAVTDEVLY